MTFILTIIIYSTYTTLEVNNSDDKLSFEFNFKHDNNH